MGALLCSRSSSPYGWQVHRWTLLACKTPLETFIFVPKLVLYCIYITSELYLGPYLGTHGPGSQVSLFGSLDLRFLSLFIKFVCQNVAFGINKYLKQKQK